MKLFHLISERQRMRMTQTEVARRIGITKQQYSRIEAGYSAGSVDVWRKLSALFEKPIDYLLSEETG